MPLSKPYPNIYRHGAVNTLGVFAESIKSEQGIDNISAYEILKNDLKLIFQFIEPSPQNFNVFSHKTFDLLLRACTEVESLCKQIFSANNHEVNSINIIRFSDLEPAMQLSSYRIKSYGFNYPIFSPFSSFSNEYKRSERSPQWYKAYNKAKHNRKKEFASASLKNAIEAIGGVYALLVAMYGLGFDHNLKISFYSGHMADHPSFFRVESLPEWSKEEQYQYNWEELKKTEIPYAYHRLSKIP